MPGLHGDDIRTLLEPHEPPCVTMVLPTSPARGGGRQDPVRLKNLVEEAERRLKALGLRAPDAKAVLQPARELLDDGRHWLKGRGGLAVFLSPGWHHVVVSPVEFQELLVVSGRFHIRPLVQASQSDRRFFLLSLSRSGTRLFTGSRFEFTPVEVPGMPQGIQVVEQYLVRERQLQAHTGARPGGSPARVLHGHGPGDDPDDDRVLEYFRQVDAAVVPHLRARSPLVLAAVEYLVPLYRRATSWEDIPAEALLGSPDGVPDNELHRRAWNVIARRTEAERAAQLDRYAGLAAKGRASADLHEIAAALREARVETLFLADEAVVWGSSQNGDWQVHEQPGPGDEDLLDRAAAETLRTGGVVYSLPGAELPSAAPHAAILRF